MLEIPPLLSRGVSRVLCKGDGVSIQLCSDIIQVIESFVEYDF
jgi:hypothetical protein